MAKEHSHTFVHSGRGVGGKRDVDEFLSRAARLHPALSDRTYCPGFADIFGNVTHLHKTKGT